MTSINQQPPPIKAIETHYKGYRFRSRLEARWAVFFDALGIAYEYEPEGFEIPFEDSTIRYLPDFRLTDLNLWVEVKGSKEQFDNDAARIAWMVDFGHLPGVSDGGGLVILGPVPEHHFPILTAHPVLSHEKGVRASLVSFIGPKSVWSDTFADAPISSAPDLPDIEWMFGKGSSYLGSYLTFPGFPEHKDHKEGCPFFEIRLHAKDWSRNQQKAYRAARSARFEHGERPC